LYNIKTSSINTMSSFSGLKKIIIKAGSIKLFLSAVFLAAIFLNLNHTLDTSSKQHVDKSFNRALITFGIAKTLNGVISVAQGTEIAIQPAGIGINLTPGQILDPVNDLVERFSWIMLLSTTSLGVQKIFLTMSVWPYFSDLLVFFLTLGLILLFIETNKYFSLRLMIIRISLLLIVLRFAVPITGLANEFIYQVFLEKDYTTSTKILESTAQEIGQLNENEQLNLSDIKKKSVWESAKSFYKSTAEMLNINKKIETYKQAASQTARHVINLIVVFLFQTIIIPLGFIFIIYTLLKYSVKFKL
jgi:hypothetical protein